MKNHFAISFLLLFAIAPIRAFAQAELPGDVSAFVERRNICDHFRGEHTGGASRARDAQVNEASTKYCSGTDLELARLRKTYAQNPQVILALSKFEDCIDGEGGKCVAALGEQLPSSGPRPR